MFEASKKAQQLIDTIKASNGIKSDVSTRSCIGCKYCACLSGKGFKISYACKLRIWKDIKNELSELKGLTCGNYETE